MKRFDFFTDNSFEMWKTVKKKSEICWYFFPKSPKFRETLLSEFTEILPKLTETDRNFAKQITSFGGNPNFDIWPNSSLIWKITYNLHRVTWSYLDMDIDGHLVSDFTMRTVKVDNSFHRSWREYAPTQISSFLNPTIYLLKSQ